MRTIPLPRLGIACFSLLLVLPLAWARQDEATLRKEALSLNGVLGDEAIKEKVTELKTDPARAKKLLAAALAAHKQQDTTFNYSASLILATVAKDLKVYETADVFYRRAVVRAEEMKSDRRLSVAYFHWISMQIENQKYAEAEKLCKQLLELQRSPEELAEDEGTLAGAKLLALRRLIQVSALQGKIEQAEKTLKPFLEKAPNDLDVMDINAWLLRYQEKNAEALKVYEKILEALSKEERVGDLRDEYQEIVGSLYGDLGNIDKAMELLLPLLKKKPDDAGLNNDIGFMWVDHDKNLDEAARLIRKAVEKEPDNPSYLDSLGWLLYKQKQYAEAKKQLLKAVTYPRGNNTEILDHLGDVYAAMGEKTEALAAWKKAASVATSRQKDQKRKEMIEEKVKKAQP